MSDMKRVTIPMNDGLVKTALETAAKNADALTKIEGLSESAQGELEHIHFDYLGLVGIFSGKYKVTIEISENDFHAFSHNHGVDFPNFIELEVVDIHEEDAKKALHEEEDDEKPQFFQSLAYVEDGELNFAIRSNKMFPGADDEGADPQDEDATRFHLYKTAKPGEVVFFEGTTFAAVPTKSGWAIIENGEALEEIEF